jgi:hypothetical protein
LQPGLKPNCIISFCKKLQFSEAPTEAHVSNPEEEERRRRRRRRKKKKKKTKKTTKKKN